MFKGVEEALKGVSGANHKTTEPILTASSPVEPSSSEALPPTISFEDAISQIGEIMPDDDKRINENDEDSWVDSHPKEQVQSLTTDDYLLIHEKKELLSRPRSSALEEKKSRVSRTKIAQKNFEEKTKLDMLSGKIILRRLTLFEAFDRFVLVGSNRTGKYFRIILIERNVENHLQIDEEEALFDAKETRKYLLDTHKRLASQGGLRMLFKADALLGCVKIWSHYYLLFVTQKHPVGIISGRYIYQVKETNLVPIVAVNKKNKISSDELKYKAYFQSVDLTEDFYFSYSYDITNTFQNNCVNQNDLQLLNLNSSGDLIDDTKQSTSTEENAHEEKICYNEKFLWNFYHSGIFLSFLNRPYWLVPLIHGYFEQKTVKIGTQLLTITLVARRSRHYAGTRYNKRGISSTGHVANEVETEQIVTSEKPWILGGGEYTSFVMLRGSIPLFWKQTNPLAPKPDITIYKKEEKYQTTKMHFNRLIQCYGCPIVVFNLIRKSEKRPQEVVIGAEFETLIGELGEYYRNVLKKDVLSYLSYDFLSEMRAKNNVTADIFKLSTALVDLIGWFYHNVAPQELHSLKKVEIKKLQSGFVRVNCIDCLDRTNIAQFCLGLAALGNQLHQLGAIDDLKDWESRHSELMELLQKMYTNQGDRIANQYGGSGTMHKATLEKTQSTDLAKIGNALTAVKRYYSNNFLDIDKQYGINVFLGSYISSPDKPHIWDIEPEKSLHEIDFLFPAHPGMFAIPFFPSSHRDQAFDFFFDERYDPYRITFFDSELEQGYAIPLEIKKHHSNKAFAKLNKNFKDKFTEIELAEGSTVAGTIPRSVSAITEDVKGDCGEEENAAEPRSEQLQLENPDLDSNLNSNDNDSESLVNLRKNIQREVKKDRELSRLERQYSNYLNVEAFLTGDYTLDIDQDELEADNDTSALLRDLIFEVKALRAGTEIRLSKVEHAILK